MKTFYLVKREISHRKLVFLTGVLSLAIATAGLIFASMILSGHDIKTGEMLVRMEKELRGEMVRQEDYYRRVMRDMGHNVLILSGEQDMAELRSLGHPTTYLDYEDVWKLAHGEIDTINHLLPVLQEKIFWEEEEMEIMLSGIRGQVPVFAKPEFLTDEEEYRSPIVERVPAGKADLGYTVATELNLRTGEPVVIMGEEFEVNRIYNRRGTSDDITVWIPLDSAQAILGREGKINGILALECVCELDQLGKITEQVKAILPHTQVFEFSSLISVRADVRRRAGEAHREVVASVMGHREASRAEKERFAQTVIPLLLAGAAVWIFLLIFHNARERRAEIGILRAVGFARMRILNIFLVKSLIMGAAGGAAGCLAGIAAGIIWSGGEVPAGELIQAVGPGFIAVGFLLAPLISLAAGFIPAVFAANHDPADILREE